MSIYFNSRYVDIQPSFLIYYCILSRYVDIQPSFLIYYCIQSRYADILAFFSYILLYIVSICRYISLLFLYYYLLLQMADAIKAIEKSNFAGKPDGNECLKICKIYCDNCLNVSVYIYIFIYVYIRKIYFDNCLNVSVYIYMAPLLIFFFYLAIIYKYNM